VCVGAGEDVVPEPEDEAQEAAAEGAGRAEGLQRLGAAVRRDVERGGGHREARPEEQEEEQRAGGRLLPAAGGGAAAAAGGAAGAGGGRG